MSIVLIFFIRLLAKLVRFFHGKGDTLEHPIDAFRGHCHIFHQGGCRRFQVGTLYTALQLIIHLCLDNGIQFHPLWGLMMFFQSIHLDRCLLPKPLLLLKLLDVHHELCHFLPHLFVARMVPLLLTLLTFVPLLARPCPCFFSFLLGIEFIQPLLFFFLVETFHSQSFSFLFAFTPCPTSHLHGLACALGHDLSTSLNCLDRILPLRIRQSIMCISLCLCLLLFQNGICLISN
mmetsp:Transcript_6709/g.15272  ORF Transcript_6709/g.15272 Transcript_6709/m.15272 type:complete len:233 (-) Transcript_6709:267-965(-)